VNSALRSTADRQSAALVTAWEAAVDRGRGSVSLEAVATLLSKVKVPVAAADLSKLEVLLEVRTILGTFQVDATRIVLGIVRRGGLAALRDLNASPLVVKPVSVDAFLAAAPRTARATVGKLITGLSAKARETVREVVANGIRDGLPVEKIARQLREHIGLDTARAGRQLKLEVALRSNRVPRWALEEVYRQRRRGAVTLEAFVDRYQAGAQAAQVDSWLAAALDQRKASRALAIARTEVARAATETQKALWEQAIESGSLPRGRYMRRWNRRANPAPCPVCGPLRGSLAPIGGSYRHAYKGGPPAHPHCRCFETLELIEAGSRRRAA